MNLRYSASKLMQNHILWIKLPCFSNSISTTHRSLRHFQPSITENRTKIIRRKRGVMQSERWIRLQKGKKISVVSNSCFLNVYFEWYIVRQLQRRFNNNTKQSIPTNRSKKELCIFCARRANHSPICKKHLDTADSFNN